MVSTRGARAGTHGSFVKAAIHGASTASEWVRTDRELAGAPDLGAGAGGLVEANLEGGHLEPRSRDLCEGAVTVIEEAERVDCLLDGRGLGVEEGLWGIVTARGVTRAGGSGGSQGLV